MPGVWYHGVKGMSWTPGSPVAAQQDHAEWEEWRRESKREAQRQRRALYPTV